LLHLAKVELKNVFFLLSWSPYFSCYFRRLKCYKDSSSAAKNEIDGEQPTPEEAANTMTTEESKQSAVVSSKEATSNVSTSKKSKGDPR
jgi:hypothetical protein